MTATRRSSSSSAGTGRAVIDGENHPMQPGSAFFIGKNRRHMFINEGSEDIVWTWLIVPNGLEDFFRLIGRPRAEGEPTRHRSRGPRTSCRSSATPSSPRSRRTSASPEPATRRVGTFSEFEASACAWRDKVAIITGSAAGIGAAAAEIFVREGAKFCSPTAMVRARSNSPRGSAHRRRRSRWTSAPAPRSRPWSRPRWRASVASTSWSTMPATAFPAPW